MTLLTTFVGYKERYTTFVGSFLEEGILVPAFSFGGMNDDSSLSDICCETTANLTVNNRPLVYKPVIQVLKLVGPLPIKRSEVVPFRNQAKWFENWIGS